MSEALLSLAFSPDGSAIAAGFANQVVRVWANAGGPPRRTLNGTGFAEQVAFSPGSDRVASSAIDVWDVESGRLLTSANQHFEAYQDLVVSPDGRLVALAGYSHIELRSLEDGSLVREIAGIPGPVRRCLFIPGDKPSPRPAGTDWCACTR